MTDTSVLERDLQKLERLAELDLALAERVHACAMAATDTAEIVDLGRTYQRVARSLRQTLALKAKLVRDAAQDGRAAQPARDRDRDPAVIQRKQEAREAVQRLIWTEAERDEHHDLLENLEFYLAFESREPGFVEGDLRALVVRLCGWLELSQPPEPPVPAPADAPPEPWRGAG